MVSQGCVFLLASSLAARIPRCSVDKALSFAIFVLSVA